MVGFPERRRAMVDAAFATFGEDAAWEGIDAPVRVRFGREDREAGFGSVTLVESASVIRVRSWEVQQPEAGQIVMIDDGPQLGLYALAEPILLDGKGVWTCRHEVAS